MKSDQDNIYIIDSSALITINRFYPKTIFPDLWKHLEDLFKQGRLWSHDMVYDEIIPSAEPQDEIGRLIAKHRNAFQAISNRQGQIALEILATFPRLIDARAKKDQADPWIIAQAIEKIENQDLFGGITNLILVSAESPKSDSKIPAVCKYFKVPHMNLFEFFEDNGWQFSMDKKK